MHSIHPAIQLIAIVGDGIHTFSDVFVYYVGYVYHFSGRREKKITPSLENPNSIYELHIPIFTVVVFGVRVFNRKKVIVDIILEKGTFSSV